MNNCVIEKHYICHSEIAVATEESIPLRYEVRGAMYEVGMLRSALVPLSAIVKVIMIQST